MPLRLSANANHFSARGRHKTKRNVFSTAYYFWQKISPYWLYMPVVPINKGLQSLYSVFTVHQ